MEPNTTSSALKSLTCLTKLHLWVRDAEKSGDEMVDEDNNEGNGLLQLGTLPGLSTLTGIRRVTGELCKLLAASARLGGFKTTISK